MCEADFIKIAAGIAFTVALILLCYVLYHSVKGEFKSKNTPKQPEEYNEHNLPKGCQLIQMEDKYMFKIKRVFADLTFDGYRVLKEPNEVQIYCMTKDKEYAIKRGIETFMFFKALGKI